MRTLVHVYYIYCFDMFRGSEDHPQGALNARFKTDCQPTGHSFINRKLIAGLNWPRIGSDNGLS